MTEPRTDGEIMERVVPGVTSITLGGKEYPFREMVNKRARSIRRAIAEYDVQRKQVPGDSPEQAEIMDVMLDAIISQCSPEVEADWERIEETATDDERMAAMLVIHKAVVAPFVTVADALGPTQGNRKARRTSKKPSRKSTT